MNAAAEADVLQIINDLNTQYHVGQVIVTGASMGGTGADFTALHPDLVDGVCAVNGLANFVGYTSDNPTLVPQVQAAFAGTGLTLAQEYAKRSAINSPQSFTMPMAVTAGMLDATVPPQSEISLANTVKSTVNPNVVSFVRATGGHSTNYVDNAVALEYVVQKAKGIDTDLHPITVNTSFEYQSLSTGGTVSTIDGWTVLGTVGVTKLTSAAIAAKFNGGSIPDGSQVAFVKNGDLFQYLGTTVQAGTYHLSFKTASEKGVAAAGDFLTGFMVDDSNVGTADDLAWGVRRFLHDEVRDYRRNMDYDQRRLDRSGRQFGHWQVPLHQLLVASVEYHVSRQRGRQFYARARARHTGSLGCCSRFGSCLVSTSSVTCANHSSSMNQCRGMDLLVHPTVFYFKHR